VDNPYLSVATFNLEGGARSDLLPEVVADGPDLDILFLQEAKSWDADGQRRAFEAEILLRPLGLDRGFLTPSTWGTIHTMVFIRSAKLRPMRHVTQHTPGVCADQIGTLELGIPGLQRLLTVRSVHWRYWSGTERESEAMMLTRFGAPDACAIIAGDCNSLAPDCTFHDPEREPDWPQLPAHKRQHKSLMDDDGTYHSDRRALTRLARAGLVNVGCMAGDVTPTVYEDVDLGQGGRIDHILVSPLLSAAIMAETYRVHSTEVGREASDHCMVSACFDLSRVALPLAVAA
jgi:endonuclease/exonuclease/phosphatase family metal-dependent hydrolase